jgi:hypothetical protein
LAQASIGRSSLGCSISALPTTKHQQPDVPTNFQNWLTLIKIVVIETMSGGTLSLLQLPRNIRDRIWGYAYGDLVVHAQPKNYFVKQTRPEAHAFEYFLCQDTEDPLTSPKMTQCYPGTCGSADNKRAPFFWPIVSKQFWAESIEIFYPTATFKVGGSVDLYILASSQQQSVRRMRNLIVKIGFGLAHHNRIWSLERCANMIRNFESLRGLTLLIGLGVDDNSNYTGTCISYNYDNRECSAAIGNSVTRGSRMQGDAWEESKNWFPVFLRSFQQHHLQEDLTRVKLFDRHKKRTRDNGGGYFYHAKDPRRAQEEERRNDEAIQEDLRKDLAASMRAMLLGQNVSYLFPDWKAEDKRLLEEQKKSLWKG